MASSQHQYDSEYKAQAVKLAQEMESCKKAAVELGKYGITQSMNSDGGRCHYNARCESMWARMKTELLYDRYNTEKMAVEDVKTLI